MNIYIVGKQWMWKAEHPGGQHEINALHVPAGRPVQLTMISMDVFHSFSIPDFRVKREVIPGRYSTVWFQATDTRHLPPLLHAVLRHKTLRHDRRSHCNDAGGLPEVDGRVDQRYFAGPERRASLRQHGLQPVPQRLASGTRSQSRREFTAAKLQLTNGSQVLVNDAYLAGFAILKSVGTRHSWLRADYAHLPGADQRRWTDRPGRVHQAAKQQLSGPADAGHGTIRCYGAKSVPGNAAPTTPGMVKP